VRPTCFREIIREVPGFAPAYSSLVQLNNSMHLAHPGVFREREREQQTLTLARAARRSIRSTRASSSASAGRKR
jgi:hypothetical protein